MVHYIKFLSTLDHISYWGMPQGSNKFKSQTWIALSWLPRLVRFVLRHMWILLETYVM